MSDPMKIVANPLNTLFRKKTDEDFEEIARIVREQDAELVVCGLPKSMNNQENAQTAKTREFAEKLKSYIRCPLNFRRATYDGVGGARSYRGRSAARRQKKRHRQGGGDNDIAKLSGLYKLSRCLFNRRYIMNEEKIDVNGLDEDLVVLTTDDGVEHNFYHVATVDYKNEWYVFFQPAEEIPDIDDDEVVIFRLEEDENGEDLFVPIEDENLLNEVL